MCEYQIYVESSPSVSHDAKRVERIKPLLDVFVKQYGKGPEFACRAPGRVNLIGEHIDYMG